MDNWFKNQKFDVTTATGTGLTAEKIQQHLDKMLADVEKGPGPQAGYIDGELVVAKPTEEKERE
jgi:hypothetical protein